MSQEAHLTPCSLQKPQAPEARPKLAGTGPPAKPVLLRSSPKPLTPAPPAKTPKPPTKPVAAPILAQDRSSPETSECPVPAGLVGVASQAGLGGVVSLRPLAHSFALPRAGPALHTQLGALPAAHAADQEHRQAVPAAAPGGPAQGPQVSPAPACRQLPPPWVRCQPCDGRSLFMQMLPRTPSPAEGGPAAF